MKTYEIVWKSRDVDDGLFPEGLDDDPTLLFHGTSSTREKSIDRDGLKPNAAGVSPSRVLVLLECFKALRWHGTSPAGAAVLSAWTLKNDFRDGDTSPLYLADHPSQAVYFSTRGVCGGEKVSSFLRAFEDLERLVTDPVFRAASVSASDQWYDDGAGRALSNEALERVRHQMLSLADIAERARRERDEYRYAVVYAIRPPPSIRATWEDCKGMGIRVPHVIPPAWFSAKLRIHPPNCTLGLR